jgi:signal transduction histidine kinase/CheY-like chemotaxis protein
MPNGFDLTSGFLPHGFCLRWDAPLVFVFVAANLGIAIAYFAIPLALRYFVGKRKDLPYPHMFRLFAAFILSCGITHLAKIWTLYQPAYWYEALIDGWTAVVSLITAALLWPLLPKALALRSPAALAAANEQLETMNKQLTALNDELATVNLDLRVARDQALEASNLKSAFIANISHELRTPLSGVLGMNELLMTTELNDGQRKYAQVVHDSARSLLSLVNDILDLSKIEAGKLNIEFIALSPGRAVDEAVKLLSAAAVAKGLELRVEISEDVPEQVFGDPIRLHQVLLNLVGNAIKFTHHGSILVKAEIVGDDEQFATVRFSISDTGIGIADGEKKFLFMPFTQIDQSTTRRYGGTGLGLTISKRLVELMGGEIGVQSEKSKGSIFWFSLPFRKQGTLRAEPSQIPAITFDGRAAKVLVVEDNATLQTLVSMQLEGLGLTADVVTTGEEALDITLKERYDMILMDCHLPHMDGYEATKLIRVREDNTDMHIPIVAMTAGAMKGDPERCLAVGMDDYLAKPYTLDQLREKLERWIT